MSIFSESNSLEGLTPEDIIPATELPPIDYSAPIVQRELPEYLDDFTNLSFTGTFRTTDDRDNASIGFITVYRDDKDDNDPDKIAHYYNGYGIAVRQSTNASQLNVFVVDNALAVQDVVLEDVLHTGWGDYAYLAATHIDISPDTTYNFRIDVGDGNSLTLYLWTVSSAFPGMVQLTYGAYIPVSDGRSYGVSTSTTDGYRWFWDNLSISHLTSNYAIELYEFDASSFSADFHVKGNAYAYGYNGTIEENGIIMYVWNYLASEWDELDRHIYGPGTASSNITLASVALSKGRYVSGADGKARVVLVSLYPSDFNASIDSSVVVDYIYLECWDSALAHVGGMGDVFIKINESPSESSFDIQNVDATEWILDSNTGIITDLELPILWIRNIELLDITGNPSGVSLDPLTNWSFVVRSEEKRFSPKEENELLFSGAALGGDVRVHYYSYPSLTSMQDYCDTEIRRNVTDDYLVKTYWPAELFISLSYVGSLSLVDARTILSQWINSGTRKSLSTTDIAIKLQAEEEINDVTVNSISYILHKKNGDTETVTGSRLIIDDREHFILIPDATHMEVT